MKDAGGHLTRPFRLVRPAGADEQLVRLRSADVGEDAIRLYDLKGRPGQGAQPHFVPLVALALEALREAGRGEKNGGVGQ